MKKKNAVLYSSMAVAALAVFVAASALDTGNTSDLDVQLKPAKDMPGLGTALDTGNTSDPDVQSKTLFADDIANDAIKASGVISLTKYDSSGNVMLTQTSPNLLTEEGADYILQSIFEDGGTDIADNVRVGSICVTDQSSFAPAAGNTASSFDQANGLTTDNCMQDNAVTYSGQTATIGPLTFAADGTNFADATTITGIGICSNESADNNAFNNCNKNGGILLASVAITDVIVNTGETVQITYTFDMLP